MPLELRSLNCFIILNTVIKLLLLLHLRMAQKLAILMETFLVYSFDFVLSIGCLCRLWETFYLIHCIKNLKAQLAAS